MVGMSGKNSEPRRGHASQSKKQGSGPPASTKPKPPVEALQMAKILGDDSPSDLQEKVQQVRSIVTMASEMEVSLALHDNDYDIEKAVSALLDNVGMEAQQSEWTTSAGGRKGKKKTQNEPELIIAPGDQKTKGQKNSKGTSKAAPQPIREGYGGNVQVTTDGSRGGRTTRKVQNSRVRSNSGRRSDRPRPPGRTMSGRGVSDSRERLKSRDRPRGTGLHTGGGDPASVSLPSSGHESSPSQLREESWDTDLLPPSSSSHGAEVWRESPSGPVPNAVSSSSSPDWVMVETSPGTPEAHLAAQWEEPQTVVPSTTSDLGSVFPEAIPSHPFSLVAVSTAETTSAAMTTTAVRQEGHSEPLSSEMKQVGGVVVLERTPGRLKQKQKRIARSQIPTKPVEMPGIDTLDVEFGNLGIDFLGLESADIEQPQAASLSPPTTPTVPTSTVATSRNSPCFETSSAQLDDTAALLTYTSAQHFVEKSPMSTLVQSYQALPATESVTPKLEAPPGLKHPTQQQVDKAAASLLPSSLSLSQTHSSPPHTSSEVTAAVVPPQAAALPLTSHEPTSLAPFTSGGASLPPLPQSIELPSSSTSASVTLTEQSAQYSTYSISSGMSTSGTDMLLSSSQSHSTQAHSSQPHSSTTTIPTSNASIKTPQAQHINPQVSTATGKHSQVPPNMLYQHVMPQYPFIPMPVSPAYYSGDPDQMNRFPASVYYQPHASSSDPSFAVSISRDHTASGFSAEGSKFTRGNSDVTSPVSSNQQQQHSGQQQQGKGLQQAAFVNPAAAGYYPGMVYPMYHPTLGVPTGYSSQMGPKPSTGTAFPGVSSYQAAPTPGSFPTYDDMSSAASHDFQKQLYGNSAAGKTASLPSTTGSSDVAFKHQNYDSKSNAGYGYPTGMHMAAAGGTAGGFMGAAGFMQVPGMPMHMPMVHHDNSQTRGQMQKPSKSHGGGAYWGGGTYTS